MHQPRSRRSLRRSVAVVGALVALSAAACGVSADQSQVSTGGFAAGADTSSWGTTPPKDSDTVTIAATMTIAGIPDSPALEATVSGTVDEANEAAQLTIDLGDLSKLGAEGMGDLPADAGQVEMIVVDDAIYVKSSLLDSFGGAEGKPWVKLTLDELTTGLPNMGGESEAETDGGTPSGSGSGSGSEPGSGSLTGGDESVISLLESVGTGITDVGTESVRGTPTRHVRTTLDLEKLMTLGTSALPDELSGQLGDLDSMFGELSSTVTVPVDVWIDQDGRIRKATVSADFAEAKARGSLDLSQAEISATIEAYDYDKPVEITAPPASQVRTFDPSDMLGGLLDGALGGN